MLGLNHGQEGLEKVHSPHSSNSWTNYMMHELKGQANEGGKMKQVNLMKWQEGEERWGGTEGWKETQDEYKGFGFDFLWLPNPSSGKRRAGSDASKGLWQGSVFVAKMSQAVNMRLLDQLGVPNGHGQEETRVWEFSSKKARVGDLFELHGEWKR